MQTNNMIVIFENQYNLCLPASRAAMHAIFNSEIISEQR